MNIPKIQKVKPESHHRLLVEFSDGLTKEYDVTPLLKESMFESLKEPSMFASVKIDTGGYAVVWDSDTDISEYELWKNGKTVSIKVVSTEG